MITLGDILVWGLLAFGFVLFIFGRHLKKTGNRLYIKIGLEPIPTKRIPPMILEGEKREPSLREDW